MDYPNNNIDAMVHMRMSDARLAESATAGGGGDDSALERLLDQISQYGDVMEKAAEDRLDGLQERFVECVRRKLDGAGVTLDHKLSITLSEEQNLLLHCAEDDEAILNALGTDAELQHMFAHLQKLAVTAQGVRWLNAAASDAPWTRGEQYAMCLKGGLSHFYFK